MGGTEATAPESFGSEYHPGMCAPGEVKTPFATHESIDTMHAMLAWAKPDIVIRVAGEWQHIHDHLVGGSGSVKSDFDKAVDHILQHWEGDAADAFAKKAKKISKQIADCASYAKYTSMAMDSAGSRLRDIKPKVDAIEPPSKTSSVLNSVGDGFTRDDTRWRGAIHNNQGAQAALDNYDDDLSAGREEQLKAAALMEKLALSYTSQTKAMGSWQRKQTGDYHDQDDYPGEPGGFVPVPVPLSPDGPTPPPVVGPPTAHVPSGHVAGGGPSAGQPAPLDGLPASKTNIDAAATTHPTNTGHAEPTTSAPRTATPSAGGPGAVPPSEMPGGPGRVGRASGNRGMPRAGGGSGSGAAEEHAASGRRGGMHAGGGGGGGGGKGSGGAAGRGPLARRKGGKLDEPHQTTGGARPVGQGLHSSRGGSQASERGRNAGMRGAPISSNAKGKDEKKNEEERPDYLVEDEETWMPKRRDVAPPTVD